MTTKTSFRYVDIPLVRDRGEGFRWVRSFGEVFQAEDGTWVLASAEAVRFAQRNPDIFSSARAFGATGLPLPLIPVGIDPPQHEKYRKVLDPMFAPRVVNSIEDDLRQQVHDLIAPLAARGSCDVIADIAHFFPTQVFMTMFGLPLSERDRLIRWVATINENSTTGTAEPNPIVVEAALAMFGYLGQCIEEKRKDPGDDVLSRILALTGDDAWTNEEILGLTWLITLAGLDTVMGAIGFLMLHLARNPDLRKRGIADPESIGRVVEEVLRLEPPAPTNDRVTNREVTVCGVTIPADASVVLCIGSANRSDTRESPDAIDLDQNERAHVTFGGGIHRCLGSHLARRELRLVVEEFHKLIPEYELAPGYEPEVVWPSGTLHLTTLPLVFPVAGPVG